MKKIDWKEWYDADVTIKNVLKIIVAFEMVKFFNKHAQLSISMIYYLSNIRRDFIFIEHITQVNGILLKCVRVQGITQKVLRIHCFAGENFSIAKMIHCLKLWTITVRLTDCCCFSCACFDLLWH